jgi:translation initiation factor IF-2
MAGKVLRLSKVAKELNVGIATIVDFLSSKGIEIDSNPNTKLEDPTVEVLFNQFAADQSVKEKSKQASLVKERKKETISLRDGKEKEDADDSEDDVEINIDAFKASMNKPMTTVTEKPKPEEAPQVEPAQEEPAQEEKKTIGEGEVKVSVVGKIDLDKLNTKTRPDKQKKSEKSPVAEKTEQVRTCKGGGS